MIRDYNQCTLLAPPETLYRNLGHPNGAKIDKEEHMVIDGFRPVFETKSINSTLFGRTLEYGLGYRLRMVDIGRYGPSTASSRVFWDGEYVNILAKVQNVSFNRFVMAVLLMVLGTLYTHTQVRIFARSTRSEDGRGKDSCFLSDAR
jgi:hypothetical protein